jgi:hypothetical protein
MATERPAKAKRILVVEDEPMIRMLLEDMLGELGYPVAAPYACPTTPPSGRTSKGSRPLPQKETEKRRFPENVISTDKSVLLWMYCREIAPFETPTFGEKVGELIARATSTPSARL